MEPNQIVEQPVQLPSTPPQQTTPSASAPTPQPNPSKLPTILLILISLVSLSGLVYFYIQTQSLKQQLVLQPSPTPTTTDTQKIQPSPTTDPTATWKIFTHPTQKYQFKYPPEWKTAINKNAAAETLFGPTATNERGDGGIEVREIPELDPQQFLDLNIVEILEQKQITLPSGITGYRTTYKSMLSGINFVFKYKDGLIYNVYLNAKSPSELNTKLFDEIISTFKFTDSQ